MLRVTILLQSLTVLLLLAGLNFDLNARYSCRAGEKCCFNQEDCIVEDEVTKDGAPCSMQYDTNCELCCVARNQGDDPGEEKLEQCLKTCSASRGHSAGHQPQNVDVPQ